MNYTWTLDRLAHHFAAECDYLDAESLNMARGLVELHFLYRNLWGYEIV